MHSTHPKADALRSLIRDRAVRSHFQPIVDLNDGMVVAYEALCRPLPDSGFSNPAELFDAAGECGLLWELEQVTRGAAMDASAHWPRDVRLFLNNSPSVFADERFAGVLREDLSKFEGMSTDHIVLEITERAESKFDEQLLKQVTLAKDAGFNIAVDDAGAGTSGLNRMMQIRPHWIKLDRQLIAGIDADAFKQNLVRSFVHFARMSGVSVIAEGIEKAAELASLMGLGIRFGQGYFLGKPGDRASTMDPSAISAVREKWASVEATMPSEPHVMPMARLCRDALVIDASLTSIADVAAQLSQGPEHPGAVVTEGRRLIGWADRRSIMAAFRDESGRSPITSITRPAVCAIAPDATVQEALQFVCTREDDDISQPIIIAAGPEVVGIVALRELLRAAASESRSGSRQRATLTGLPARVRADQHLEQMISLGQDASSRMGRDYHADAAFIDVRRFADYNGVFGCEMGDRLIRTLSEQIFMCVVRATDDVFLSHLGDDRFMVTARSGILEPRLRLLMQTFEQSSPALTDPSLIAKAPAASNSRADAKTDSPRMGLRVLLLPGVFDRVAHPREVYRVEQQLRQKARNQEVTLGAGQSLLVRDERNLKAKALRLSA